MKCKKCEKECLEEEMVDGFCLDCIKKFKNNPEELGKKENKIAKTLKIINIISLVVGIIISLSLFVSEPSGEGFAYALVVFIISIAYFLFILGFAEIIQLLEDIKNK